MDKTFFIIVFMKMIGFFICFNTFSFFLEWKGGGVQLKWPLTLWNLLMHAAKQLLSFVGSIWCMFRIIFLKFIWNGF